MLLNYNVNIKPLNQIDFSSIKVINTINPHSYCVSKQDKDFEQALQASDVLLPDGIGIVWAERLLNKNKIEKIAGFDLFIYMMQSLEEKNGSCFFLGASEETLVKIANKIKQEFPHVKVGSFSPPYKAEFNTSDNELMCGKVNSFNPDVLFVGMTAPKQEKWVHSNKNNLNASLICSIGAVFDFYAGTVKRPHPFWIKLGLEWFIRLVKEPRRLFKRNFVSTPTFVFYVLKEKFKLSK
ncbi:MAG: WecB/TagA/CpsF family glycosyltransferase [Lutibacter sp.]|jgi:N-acetylglucosaminyldiphosphoundecaprenol N-acetyl-beta-D-mannosaminyltransferase